MVISVVRYPGRSFLPPDLPRKMRESQRILQENTGNTWNMEEAFRSGVSRMISGRILPESTGSCWNPPEKIREILDRNTASNFLVFSVSRRTSFTWVCGDQETFQTSGSMNDLTLDETKMVWYHVRDAHPIEFRQI